MIHEAAVIIPTILRDQLRRAVRSVFEQDLKGSIQIMLGIDHAEGSRQIVEELKAECPANRSITVLDLGYSTSSFRDGFYFNWSGGAIRTILSYAANSRYLAYLDDDNWWAPNHVSSLLKAIEGADWAYSYRWYVDPATQRPLFIDEWESIGPDKGVSPATRKGFVDTNCLMIDKQKCHWDLPAWCIASNQKGAGVDRVVFDRLRSQRKPAATELATAFYVFRAADTKLILKLGERKTDTTPVPQQQPSMASAVSATRTADGDTPPSDLSVRLDRLENTMTALAKEFRTHARTTLPQMLIEVTQQSEALDMLLRKLRVDRGWLPPTRGWAASPDFLLMLADHILAKTHSARILECGSGVSSLVIGRCLEIVGHGHLFSLEHLGAAANETRKRLDDRGLTAQVTVLRAPLKEYQFHGQVFRWYDLGELPAGDFDCLVVDGPPVDTGSMARYPAAPTLFGRVAENGTVFLDDYNRRSEHQAVQAWLREFPDWKAVAKSTEKGCAILSRRSPKT
ncbi:MAG: class I SAM-dependent methyltransferase [Pseudomonadota bacterium]